MKNNPSLPSQGKVVFVYTAGLVAAWLPMMIEGRSDFPSVGVLATAVILVLTGGYAVYYQRHCGTGLMWAKKFFIAAMMTLVSAGVVVLYSIAMLARRIIR